MDADGCFTIRNNYTLTISISQKTSEILYSIKDKLQCGNVYYDKRGNTFNYAVTDLKGIKNIILIFILLILIINMFFAQICINMFYAFSFLLYIFLFIKDGNNLNLNKESLFKLVKEYETDSKFNFKLNFESFKELSNGIFQ